MIVAGEQAPTTLVLESILETGYEMQLALLTQRHCRLRSMVMGKT